MPDVEPVTFDFQFPASPGNEWPAIMGSPGEEVSPEGGLATGGAAAGWRYIRKRADQDVTNSTTLATDSHLYFLAAEDTMYEVDLFIQYSGSSTTSDYKCNVVTTGTWSGGVSAGSQVGGWYQIHKINTTHATWSDTFASLSSTTLMSAAGEAAGVSDASHTPTLLTIHLFFKCLTPGIVSFAFANNTAGASLVSRTHSGSILRYRVLGKASSVAPGAGAPGFAPTDITGLKAWYDFSDVSTLWQDTAFSVPITTDAQTIGSVTDKSATSHDLGATSASNEPAYKTGIINGLSVARFDGTADHLQQTTSPWAADTSFTVFAVAQKRSALGTIAKPLLAMSSDNADLFTDTSFSATGYVWQYNNAGNETVIGGTATNVNCVVLRINSAASLDAYINGGTATNLNPNDAVTTDMDFILGTDAATHFGDYDIGEVVVYDSALSTANLNTVGQYLATKWGVTWTTI